MAQETKNLMKEIRLEKVVLNMGVGKSGEPIEIAKKALGQISAEKPNVRNAKKAQRAVSYTHLTLPTILLV